MKISKQTLLTFSCATLLMGAPLFAQEVTSGFPQQNQAVQEQPPAMPSDHSGFQPSSTVVAGPSTPIPSNSIGEQGAAVDAPAVKIVTCVACLPMTPETQAIFAKAFEGEQQPSFSPLCFSTQPEQAGNYRFFCLAAGQSQTDAEPTETPLNPAEPAQKLNAFVDLQVDANGAILDKKITEIKPKNLAGGWSEFKAIDEKSKEVFEQSLAKGMKIPCTPLCVSTQVVSGTNYRFLCCCERPDDPSIKMNLVGTVYVDLQGNLKITDIARVTPETLQKMIDGENLHQQRTTSSPARQAVPMQNRPHTGFPNRNR